MKDILQDVVAKTHALGFLSLVKVNSEADATTIESMAEDRSVILNSTTHNSVSEFNGTFGMPNLDKLALHLKNPEYQKDAKIDEEHQIGYQSMEYGKVTPLLTSALQEAIAKIELLETKVAALESK